MARKRAWAAVVLIALAAAALRLIAARGDLWLDEVWSLVLLSGLTSPVEIVTRLHHDNNHLLNSLLLWTVRTCEHPLVYRLPAVFAGTAAVMIAAWIASLGDQHERQRRWRMLVTATVFATSYLLVDLTSEARGYGLLLAFSWLAFGVALHTDLAPRSSLAPISWIAMMLAMLAHVIAVQVFAGLVAWSLWRWRRESLARWLAAVGWWHAVPLGGYVALYVGFLHDLTIGGGPRESLPAVIANTIGYAAGLPVTLGAGVLIGFAAVVLIIALMRLHRLRSDLWIFYVVAIVVAPAVLLVARGPGPNFERYFVLSVALWLLLAAELLCTLVHRRTGRAVVTVLVLGFLIVNAARINRLLGEGRGQYRAALAHMAATTTDSRIGVSSDHDFRNGLLVTYHAPRVDPRIVYVTRENRRVQNVQWLILHRFEGEPAPAAVLTDAFGYHYQFDSEYPSAPLSGVRWVLFRADPRK